MREYEVLFRYLKSSNWNEDGTPSDDDDYYMIGKVKAESKEQVKKWADEGNHYAMRSIGKCKEISDLFCTEDYVEDTLEIVQVLSEVGHKNLD